MFFLLNQIKNISGKTVSCVPKKVRATPLVMAQWKTVQGTVLNTTKQICFFFFPFKRSALSLCVKYHLFSLSAC